VISRRRIHLLLTLLLPLMALRALLPAGYMVSATDHGARVVMCSGGFASLDTPAGDTGHQQPASYDDCAFAHAAYSAPPPQMVALAIVPTFDVRFVSQTADQLPPATGPPRSTGARAPPAILL
jgi:hypothetical protein